MLRLASKFTTYNLPIYDQCFEYVHKGLIHKLMPLSRSYFFVGQQHRLICSYKDGLRIIVFRSADQYVKGRRSVTKIIPTMSVFKLIHWQPETELYYAGDNRQIFFRQTAPKLYTCSINYQEFNDLLLKKTEFILTKSELTLLQMTLKSGWKDLCGETQYENKIREQIRLFKANQKVNVNQ